MKTNVGTVERIARVLGGGLLVATGFLAFSQGMMGYGIAAMGCMLLMTGLMGYCPACHLMGRCPVRAH